ncbi:DUF2889 domain-containing protein [Hyphomonas johnsonii]|uniref:DUF2889 domain-containing protein n=1 Tax=Hyphomonas johnsonii MHS-2 TaxID=1280950 RepID=A0A059FUZ0_9PROT|nr:DUF2889 domain-containing protein [Hyphomonas johnsonii]KCZ94268.1 hypothetical protein HJO_02800 [Hyphomonas johnsonii MHS-2]
MSDVYPRTGGCFRRKIDLRTEADGAVVGWLEDDFHHVGLTLEHDGGRISAIRVISERLPFSSCPFAAANLQALVGQRMSTRCTDIGALVQMRQQCTHMFDLAGLAMAHCARNIGHRHYEAVIPDRDIVAWEAGKRRLLGPGKAWLLCNGEEVLHWQLDRRQITGPENWAGQPLVEGFRARTETMSLDEAEAASVLRRAIMVSSGRTLDPDLFTRASERGQSGVCYTFLKENRDAALRMFGSTLNYETTGETMLSRLSERP